MARWWSLNRDAPSTGRRGPLSGVSDESDSLVLRLLREMRADLVTKGELGALHRDLSALRHDLGDLRQDVGVGFTSTTAALTTLARRLDELDHGA